MNLKCNDINEKFRIYPDTGDVSIEIVDTDGISTNILFPLSKLDKFIQFLMHIISLSRHNTLSSNNVSILNHEDVLGGYKNVSRFRILQKIESNELGIQFDTVDFGIISLRFNDSQSREMANTILDSVKDYNITYNNDGTVDLDMEACTYIDLNRAKSPIAPLAIPERFCSTIGKILATWGQFENQISIFLKAAIAENNSTSDSPRGYNRQTKLLKKEIKILFKNNPVIINYIRELITESSCLYIKRNLIAHGQYSSTVRVQKPANSKIFSIDINMIATGEHKGKEKTLILDKIKLDDLYHDIAHLAGKMNTIFIKEQVKNLPWESDDIAFLQNFLNKIVR